MPSAEEQGVQVGNPLGSLSGRLLGLSLEGPRVSSRPDRRTDPRRSIDHI